MSNDSRLTEALRRRADSLGHARPLDLDDVKGRARGIRRRRYAATGFAVAAVLAVAVPAGLAVNDRVDRTDRGFSGSPTPDVSVAPNESPGTPTSSDRPNPQTTPRSTPQQTPGGEPKQVVLTTDVEATSSEPGILYLYDGEINLLDGSVVPVSGDYDSVVETGTGYLVTGSDKAGDRFTAHLDRAGHEVDRVSGTGVVAVSADGTLWAYEAGGIGNGELTVEWASGHATLPDDGSGSITPVAVTGSKRCDNPEGAGGCTVIYNVDGASPRAYLSDRHGQVSPMRFVKVDDESVDYRVAGQLTLSDGSPGSACWAVDGARGDQLWRTCDYELGRFSPDGRYILGYNPEGDGAGEASVSILDARTGLPVVDYRNTATTQAYVGAAAWSTDGTLVATVFEKGSWSLMRMTVDGTLSRLGQLAGGEDGSQSPLHFAASP